MHSYIWRIVFLRKLCRFILAQRLPGKAIRRNKAFGNNSVDHVCFKKAKPFLRVKKGENYHKFLLFVFIYIIAKLKLC
jgi:hypothetical protein